MTLHGPSPAISVFNGADQITYSEKGAVFNISAPYQSPTLQSKDYVFFGEIDVVVQAAPGRGIVTAITLQSDDLDEVSQHSAASRSFHKVPQASSPGMFASCHWQSCSLRDGWM